MKVTLDEITFDKMLKATKAFVSTDDTRKILQYIRLDVKPNEIIFSALDGYKATRFHVSKENAEEFTVYFPPFNFKASKSGSRKVSICKENDICTIEVETCLFVETIYKFKQPSASGIDIHKIYEENKKQPKKKIALSAYYLEKAFKAIKDLSNIYQKTAIFEMGEKEEPIFIKNTDKEFFVEELILPIRYDKWGQENE